MALKSDRYELQTDISFFYNEGVATRGGVVVHDTVGTGAAMDQGVNLVKYDVAGGVPVGILLNDVVDKDLTRTHLNVYKDEVQKGGKVTLLQIGQVTTSNIESSAAPSAGSGAFVAANGNISTSGTGARVGVFLSSKDSDGFAKVAINIA